MSDSTIKEPAKTDKAQAKAKEALAKRVAEGFEQIDRGDAVEADQKLFDQLRERIDKGSDLQRR